MGRIAIVGGGAAGFFAALACAETRWAHEIFIFEKSSAFLGKVRVSGGGRCNVTHALFDARAFAEAYPRGSRALISPLTRFGAADTIAWFQRHGVTLKTEGDGRIFPITDSSATVIDCFLQQARISRVHLRARTPVLSVRRSAEKFELALPENEKFICDRLLLATGGTRQEAGAALARSLGHALRPAVPSLFSFEAEELEWSALAGVSVPDAVVSIAETTLKARGPLLITHRGFSGPAVLRLSAWGARELHERGYRFVLTIDWRPALGGSETEEMLNRQRELHPKKLVANSPLPELPQRLWLNLLARSGVPSETKWSNISRRQRSELAAALRSSRCAINGQSLNKDEFVTCGGVQLDEVNFKTMESRLVPGLYFAGEILDLDGLTGGFNFQSAWTTGWLAGSAMAAK